MSASEFSRSGVVDGGDSAGGETPPPTRCGSATSATPSEEEGALPSRGSAPAPPRPTRAVGRQATSAVAFADADIAPDDPVLGFAPYEHPHPRSNSITPDLQREFIAALAATGVVKQAARLVGKSLEALYNLRARPGAEGFAAAWDAARARFGERLHDFASARVMEGDERPIVSQGRILGWHTVYDYPTIRFMLRHNLPAIYSAELRPGHPVYEQIARQVEERLRGERRIDRAAAIASIEAKLDKMRIRRAAADRLLSSDGEAD